MSEKLTQAQIDALLGQLNSGGLNKADDSKKIKKYDFKSPKKFTKEQLRALDSLHENFSRMLSSYLSGVLRVFCEVTVLSIEKQRYFEYNNALPDNALIGMVDFRPQNKRYSEGIFLLDMSVPLGYFMIDRLLGGNGSCYNLNRDFTEIEIAILTNTFQKVVDRLQNSWSNYLEAEFTLSEIETNARLLQALAPEDIVVIVMLDVKIKDISGNMSICIPAEILEEIIATLGIKYTRTSKRQSSEDEMERRQMIFEELLDSDLEVKAILDQAELTLQDILQLQVSDIIPLNKSIYGDIQVAIDGIPWYNAKLGEVKSKKAVKLEDLIDEDRGEKRYVR